jgi:hypothetical protein
MKVAILNGSPKPKSSASKLISEALQERIDLSADCVMCNAAKQERRKILEAIQGSEGGCFAQYVTINNVGGSWYGCNEYKHERWQE